MNKELRVVILAAGKGTRMNSDLPKVLHKLKDKPLIDYVIDESELLNPKEILIVVGFKKERVIKHTESRINLRYATQMEQLGTGHAVLQTNKLLKNEKGHILILYGDVPNIKASTLQPIIDDHIINNRDLTLITAEIDDPTGYGRIIRDKNGNLLKIIEEKDCSDNEKKISFINSGIYTFNTKILLHYIDKLTNNNNSKEYYLTQIFQLISKDNINIDYSIIKDIKEISGINTQEQLIILENYM